MHKEDSTYASPFVVVSTPHMHDMAARCCAHITGKHGVTFPHHRVEYKVFASGEVLPLIPETVRRQHVFLFHALQHPTPNDALMRMLVLNDALARASVHGITLVTPFMSYLRQDRKHKKRMPISGRMIADLIESNRQAERVITADMHADQAQGFFTIPVDNLTCFGLLADHCQEKLGGDVSNVVVVSPDFGGAVRARSLAKRLRVPVAIFEKRRDEDGVAEVDMLIGESIVGKRVIICDDIIDTGGTMRATVKELLARGAKEIEVWTTHAILSGDAAQLFADGGYRITCTDSIPRSQSYCEKNASWLTVVSMDVLLAEAVYEASLVGGSVSKLF